MRTNRNGWRRHAALILVGAVVVAACGGDDDDAAEESVVSSVATGDSAPVTAPPMDSVESSEPSASSQPADSQPEDSAPAPTEAPDGPSIDVDCVAATGDTVKIGVQYPDSAAASIPELWDSAQAAANYANECLGGLAGHEIELVPCVEDAGNTATWAACANMFVEEQVVAMAATLTGAGGVEVPIMSAAGIPYVTPSGTSAEELTDTSGLVFTLGGGVAGVLGAMAKMAVEEGIPRVGIMAPDFAFAAVQQQAALIFGAAGAEAEVLAAPSDSADISSQIQTLISNGAGALAAIGSGSVCPSFVQTVNAVDPGGVHWTIGTCTVPALVEALGPEAFEGMVQFATVHGDTVTEPGQRYNAIMDEYAPGVPKTGVTPYGYAPVMAIVEVGADLEEVTPAALAAAFAATDGAVLPAGSGSTFSCSKPAVPILPSMCGSFSIISTMVDGEPVGADIIDISDLFAE